jgi:hypothetical protein
MFCDSGRVRQWLLSSEIGLLEFALGGRIIGGGIFCDVWGGETEDSRERSNRISLNFARKRKTSGRLRMRKKIENLSSRFRARGLFLNPIYAFFAKFGARWLKIGEVWRCSFTCFR